LSVVRLEECPAERKKSRRAEPAASGRKVASVAEGTPPRARGPGIWHSMTGARPLCPLAPGTTHGYVAVFMK